MKASHFVLLLVCVAWPALCAPVEQSPGAMWAFEPARDEFKSEALLDLRYLNENVAGESGYVTLSRDRNDFVLGNGKPARFWAVGTGYYKSNLDQHARFLAKRGVNIIRFHGNITPKENLMSVDTTERDKLWRTVAAMKKAGIYVTFSPYWAAESRAKASMGYLDDGGNKNWGLLFFDTKLQAAYKTWWRQVLSEPNPYTGIPLARDPALAILQLQNEDSLLFWTSQNIKGAARKELRRQFGEFLRNKYGSLEKASATWAGARVSADQDGPDDFGNGEAALYIVWEMTQRRGNAGLQKRLADQLQFFTETMYLFNKGMSEYIRNELKCKALINPGNWRTADNVKLLDAERYSYSANEVMGVNRYYTGEHQGKHNGWAIINGDKFTDESVLLRPQKLPVTLKQPEGFPMIVPESSWVPPLSFQSEGPFMVAAYQSLTGVDGFYWFTTGEEDWRHPGSANGYMPSEGKWVCATPMLMGQWPAAALLYRSSYVKQGEPVVYEQRCLQDIWERKMPIIAEDAGFDPNRDREHFPATSSIKTSVNPLAYLVGPVLTKYGGDPARSGLADLNRFINTTTKTVRSITGELEIDYGNGLCRLNSAKAQGVTGFLKKAGTFKLNDVSITSSNEYATVLVVSMDNKELKASSSILIQVGTVARPTGWKTKPVEINQKAGEEIVSYGRAPWQIVKGDVTIAITNAAVQRAHVLDANGMSVATIDLREVGGAKELRFPEDAMYVVLK